MGTASKRLGVILVLLLSVQAASAASVNSHITVHPTSHDKDFRVTVTDSDSTHVLQLHISNSFLSNDFVVGRLNKDGSVSTQKHQPASCHYDGNILGAEKSLAAISSCVGVLEVQPPISPCAYHHKNLYILHISFEHMTLRCT